MKKLFALLTAMLFTAAGTVPARAEIKLPPDVMEYATVGINGVYSLDFELAQENAAQGV